MCTPFRVDDTFLLYEEVLKKKERYDKLYENFEDKLSKDLYIKCMNYKLTGNAEHLLHEINGNNLFDKELLDEKRKYTYIDCGAYTGDTLMQFCFFCSGNYQKIVAVEADKHNSECIQKLVEYARLTNIEIINNGCWNKKTELVFYTYDNIETTYENGDLSEIHENSQASVNKELLKGFEKVKMKLQVDTLDNMVKDSRPNLIKINTVSSDFQTLKGCVDIIKEYRPSIVIEFGTRPDDILGIPEFLFEVNPDYKLFLRQKRIFCDSKTILYAI